MVLRAETRSSVAQINRRLDKRCPFAITLPHDWRKTPVPTHLRSRRTVIVERLRSLRPSAKARLILAISGGLILIWLSFARKPWTIDVPNAGAWKLSQYVAVYVWIGVLIDFGLTMLLVLTAHWWTRPLLNVSPRKAQSSTPRWFWLLVIAAMAVNSWICWPRLWQSFWHDENYPIRNAIVGTLQATARWLAQAEARFVASDVLLL